MPSLRQRLIASATRLYPFYSGCGTIANSRLIYFLSGKHRCHAWSPIQGGDIYADLDDYVGRAAYFLGDLDKKITWICNQIVGDGDVVLDIGANIGMVTLPLSKLVGPNGQVYSFEPNPELVDVLSKTIDHNALNNVKLHPIGLGQKKEILELNIPKFNRGSASLIRNFNNPHTTKVKVNIEKLDQIVKQYNIQKVRLIKIDVEGYETSVFLGANYLLSTIQPDAILFELNERSTSNLTEEPLIKLLKSHNYDFFIIPKNYLKMQLVSLNDTLDNANFGHDFLAVQKGEKFNEIAQLVKSTN